MLLGLIALPIVGWWTIDNGSNLMSGLNAIDPNLTNIWGGSDDPWMTTFTLLGFSMIGLGFLGSPQIYVRFISIKNTKEIDQGKWVAVLFTLI